MNLQHNLKGLTAFLAVADERSFTKAAARLGVSQSALSHTIRDLEQKLGIRLLSRTTRSVAPTEAGERLLRTLGPAFDGIGEELAALTQMRDKPAGTVRITTSEHAAVTLVWPKLRKVLPAYPDINLELDLDSGLADIVTGRFDAGIRLRERIEKDMIAIPIGPDLRMAAVASPGYFADRPKPKTPKDLAAHRCINLRLQTAGGLYAWEFEKHGRQLRIRVDGQLTFNNVSLCLQAAREGFGIAYTMENQVMEDVGAGRLIRVLENWSPSFPGYHLYYPSRRQASPAFRVVMEALRKP